MMVLRSIQQLPSYFGKSDLHACIKYGFIKAKILKSVPVAEREGGAESDLHPGGVVQGQVTVDHVV